jgi:hypothetical protein
MPPYKYNQETIDTVLTELALSLQSNADSHAAFVGPRNSQLSFWRYFKGEVSDIQLSLRHKQYGYGEFISSAAALVEWLVWLRQNHCEDLPQNMPITPEEE